MAADRIKSGSFIFKTSKANKKYCLSIKFRKGNINKSNNQQEMYYKQ